MNFYQGVYVMSGKVGRLTFEAEDADQAQQLASKWGVGVEGEAAALHSATADAIPEAYDVKTACRLLGGISRKTLYRELILGNLQRIPNTRRVLVTRKSIEKRCRS